MISSIGVETIQMWKLFKCGNYSNVETIQGRKLYEEIRYVKNLQNLKSQSGPFVTENKNFI